MSSEKFVRYTKSTSPSNAIDNVAAGESWNKLEHLNAAPDTAVCFGTGYRVTVERVTDADPEAVEEGKQWWACGWRDDGYFNVAPTPQLSDRSTVRADFTDGTLDHVFAVIRSIAAPTLAEFRAAVKETTGVVLPVEEEPRWWMWNGYDWQEPEGYGVTCRDFDMSCRVYGTTTDRNDKRDALLAAARAAGKPS